ncbi:MAG: hypothetical protein GWN53_17310 [Gammaproteobacteria bacterium]|uniref:Uncharacterized protein n=1 Tax=Candidatus Kutchimonas denitrificans TaxID=3056748 RepID=A0AAE5CD13_9BACT|nr:hypothetical protein [Candidatus Kutchimonas denitrificans]NIV53601.1 hypothetical protein [Gammaproteobacteria bacterium]
MPRRENLEVRIEARDEASRALDKVKRNMLTVNTASKASFKDAGDVAEQTFSRIRRDVNLATEDYKRGILGIEGYVQALEFARNEALELRASGLKPVGTELKSFNAVMKATGGVAQRSTSGLGTVRRSLGSLAFVAAGLPGRLGSVASVLSGFAFGNLAAAGVFAGLTAIAAGFKAITKEGREAGKESQQLIDELIAASPTLQARREARRPREGRVRQQEIIQLLTEGETRQLLGGPVTLPVSDERRAELTLELHNLNQALRDNTEAEREKALERRREAVEARLLDRIINQPLPRAPDLSGLTTAQAVFPEAAGTRPGPLAGTFSRQFLEEGVAEGAQVFGDQVFDATMKEFRGLGVRIREAGEETEQDVVRGGRAMVTGLSTIASSLAQLATGEGGPGAFGGILTGFGSLLTGPAGIGLQVAGVGFSFFDALTSDSHRDTIKRANLDAMREFEREKPPATIVIRMPGFDPGSAEFQRLVDEARREAQARGFNVDIRQG